MRAHLTHFALNYAFWLNLAFGALGLYLWRVSRRRPMQRGHGDHDHVGGEG